MKTVKKTFEKNSKISPLAIHAGRKVWTMDLLPDGQQCESLHNSPLQTYF
jgi:hypothetical protein